MAKALTDIVYGKPIPEARRSQTGPLAGLTHQRERIAAGDTFDRKDLGDEVDDETWQEWLRQGSVSEDEDAELPLPINGEATAGRDYGEPLTDAEIAAIGQPGSHPGSAPGRENPPQGPQGPGKFGPAPKPAAMADASEDKSAAEKRAEARKRAAQE
jgi:hypothetical protein